MKNSDSNSESSGEELSVEETLTALQSLIEKMESSEMPLDESLAAFETGIELTRRAQKALSEAEQKVKLLLAEEGEPVLQDMSSGAQE